MKRLTVLMLILLILLAGCGGGKPTVPVEIDLGGGFLDTWSLHRGKSVTFQATARPDNPAVEVSITFTATGSLAIDGAGVTRIDNVGAGGKARAKAAVKPVGMGTGEVKACVDLHDARSGQPYNRCDAISYYVTPEEVLSSSTGGMQRTHLKHLRWFGKLTAEEYRQEISKLEQGLPSPYRP